MEPDAFIIQTDAPINVRSLLYVPSHNVSTLEFASGTEDSGVSLYARRVLIKVSLVAFLFALFMYTSFIVEHSYPSGREYDRSTERIHYRKQEAEEL